MKKLLILVSLVPIGCASTSKVKQDLMVHDYVIEHAQHFCEGHEGLHYIVPIPTVSTKTHWGDIDCEDIYKIRCQDNYLIEFNTGASGGCFDGVGHMQWDETIKEKANKCFHL